MKYRTKYYILLTLIIISLLSSLALSFAPISEVCQVGQISEGGCESVHNSPYNYTFGIQNSYYGVAIFSILSILIYSHIKNPSKKKEKYIHTAILIGALFALYFLYIQSFIIKDFCQYCLIVDVSLLISLGIILLDTKKWKKK